MKELFDKIDALLDSRCETAYVSRFYSDSDNVTIATTSRGEFEEIHRIMSSVGFSHYDTGSSYNYYMLTYKRNG